MSNHLDPTYVDEDMLDMCGVLQPGWYAMDDNHRMVLGPYETLNECELAIKEAEKSK